MRRGFWIAATVVALGCSLAAGWQAWQPPRLPVEATPTRLDFGEVRQGASLPLEFTLVNTTDQPVRLEGIYPACDCTQLELSQALLEPGDSLVLRGEWSVGARRWESETQIAVSYHVAEQRPYSLRLTARARVIPDLKLEPETLVFTADGPHEQTLRISPQAVESVRVDSVLASHPGVVAETPRQAGSAWLIQVSIEPDSLLDNPEVVVRVASDAPHESELNVRCTIGVD